MENNMFTPASEKQLDLLKRLGYQGSTEGLTMVEAKEEIEKLLAEKNAKKETPEQPKQEVVAATPNQVSKGKDLPFSVFMKTVGVKLVANTIQDESRKNQFIANIVSAVSTNKTLQECDQVSVIAGGLQADALHFPINNQLGYCYLVPFKDKNSTVKKAQFQIGYKGYIQLAIRSGQYKDINVVEVKEGELGSYNPLDGQSFNWIQNYEQRQSARTIGYVAQIELINGFKKQMYMSYEAMLDHANTYSQAFDKDIYARLQRGEKIVDERGKDMSWKYSSFWYKNFDEMAKKTMLRQILSKWGIMSVELQSAYDKDMASFDLQGNKDYIDSKEFKFDDVEDIEQEQKETNATIKVDENGVIND